jgi:hypothetical protein
MLPFRGASNRVIWGQSKPQLSKATKIGAVGVGIIVFSPVWPAHCGILFNTRSKAWASLLDARGVVENRDYSDPALFSVSAGEPRR